MAVCVNYSLVYRLKCGKGTLSGPRLNEDTGFSAAAPIYLFFGGSEAWTVAHLFTVNFKHPAQKLFGFTLVGLVGGVGG